MSRRIDKDVCRAVQEAVLAKLDELGVTTAHPAFGVVMLLVEPNPDGTQRLHLGAWHLADEEVLDILEQAPECVVLTQQREAASGARGSA